MTKLAEEITLDGHIKDIMAISEALRTLNEKLTILEFKPMSPSEQEAKRNQIKQDIRCFKRLIVMKSSLICRKDIIAHEGKL
jgi:predicted patatin/cPLA2 family phospholipase